MQKRPFETYLVSVVDERGASRRATLLRVVVGEHHAIPGDPVYVQGLEAHHTERIRADVRLTDVVAKDH
jgi:hypothetical protein